jgi:hypothetical protein
MDLREIGSGSVDWIHLAQGRDQWWALVNTVLNLWVPQKFWEFLDWLSDYQLTKKDSAPWSYFISYVIFIVYLLLHLSVALLSRVLR